MGAAKRANKQAVCQRDSACQLFGGDPIPSFAMSENESNEEPETPSPEETPPPAEETPPPAPAPAAPGAKPEGADKKVLCGVLGIVLGCLGIHKFILGYNTEGIIMAAVSVVCAVLGSFLCFPFIGYMAMAVIGLVEGIIYLTKSDEEFVATYITGKKTWF